MATRRTINLDPAIFTHPVFKPGPLCEPAAWAWLCCEASWKDRRTHADGKVVELARGQVHHSVRFMAQAWKWSKSHVDRFLDRLEAHGMIARERGTRTPLLTICNYERYQDPPPQAWDNPGTTSGTTSGTKVGQHKPLSRKALSGMPGTTSGQEAGQDPGQTNISTKESSTTRADARARESATADDGLLQQLIRATGDKGVDPIDRGWENLEPIEELIAQGCDLERDILKTIRSEVRRLTGPLKTWKAGFLKRAILKAHKERLRGAAYARPSEPAAPVARGLSLAAWKGGLRHFYQTGEWTMPGPEPGKPGCEAPAELVASISADYAHRRVA